MSGSEFGQDDVADAVALEIEIGVGGVFAPGDVAFGKPGADFCRRISRSGRMMPWDSVTGRMPLRPAVPEPRRKRKRTVSA